MDDFEIVERDESAWGVMRDGKLLGVVVRAMWADPEKGSAGYTYTALSPYDANHRREVGFAEVLDAARQVAAWARGNERVG